MTLFADDPYAIAAESEYGDETIREKAFPPKKPNYLQFVAKKNKQLRNKEISIKQYKKDLKKFKSKKYWK